MKNLILLSICFACCKLLNAQAPDTLLPVKSHHLWGFINKSGKLVIPAEYEGVDPFANGNMLTKAIKGGKALIINRSNTVIAETGFEDLHVLNDSLMAVLKGGSWGVYTMHNINVLPHLYSRISIENRDYLKLKTDTGCGLSDLHGNMIIPVRYDSIALIYHGFIVIKNGLQGLFTNKGYKVLDTHYDSIQRGAADCYFYSLHGAWGAVGDNGQALLAPEWNSVDVLSAYLVQLQKKDKSYLYSPVANRILDSTAELYIAFRPHYARVLNELRLGVINDRGQLIIKPQYEQIEMPDSFCFRVMSENEYGLIDTAGKVICKPRYARIAPFTGPFALVNRENYWGCINRHGQEVITAKYNNIQLFRRSAKAYHNGKLKVFEFDEAGNLTENNTFNHVITVSVKYRSDYGNDLLANTNALSVQRRKYTWFYDNKKKLYGLMKDSCDIKIQPAYYSINCLPDNITVVTAICRSFDYAVGQEAFAVNYTYTLVNDSICKRITPANFIYIDDKPLQKAGWKYTRGIMTDGSFVIIYHDGSISKAKYGFIDEINGPLTRFCTKTKLVVEPAANGTGSIMRATAFSATIGLSGRFYYRYDAPRINVVYYVYAHKTKWGYLNENGDVAIEPEYSYTSKFVYGTAIAQQDTKWGVIDSLDHHIIPFEYRAIDRLEGAKNKLFLLTATEPRYGIINAKGDLVAKVMYDRIGTFHEGVAVCVKKRHYGFIDSSFHQLNDTAFKDAHDLHEGLAAIRLGQRWGFVDEEGKIVIPCSFPKVGDFHSGLAFATTKGKYGYINTSGEWVIKPKYLKASDFNSYGLAIVKTKKSYQIIDAEGSVKISRLDNIAAYSEGIAIGQKGHKYLLIDSNGRRYKTLHRYRAVYDFHEGYARVQHKNKFGFIDAGGNTIKETSLGYCSDVSEGISLVGHNRRKRMFTIEDTVLHKDALAFVSPFCEGLAVVKDKDSVYYYADKSGNNAFGKKFQFAKPFQDGLARVVIGNKWAVIDHNGIVVVSPKYNDIGAFSEGKASVKISSFYGVADLKGNIIIPADYEYISYDATYKAIHLEHENQVSYLRTDGQWLWEMDE